MLMKEDGRPYTAESLARVTRISEATIQEALDRFLEIGLPEPVT